MGRLRKCFVYHGPGVGQTLGSNWSPGGVRGIPESEARQEEAKEFKILNRVLNRIINNNLKHIVSMAFYL